METAMLDHDKKKSRSRGYQWMLTASHFPTVRDIQNRREYLSHGLSGTRKNSLALAIAGVFGLEIYCVFLLDLSLAEKDFSLMFSTPPRRCVVLLEDIDSAGLIRQ